MIERYQFVVNHRETIPIDETHAGYLTVTSIDEPSSITVGSMDYSGVSAACGGGGEEIKMEFMDIVNHTMACYTALPLIVMTFNDWARHTKKYGNDCQTFGPYDIKDKSVIIQRTAYGSIIQ